MTFSEKFSLPVRGFTIPRSSRGLFSSMLSGLSLSAMVWGRELFLMVASCVPDQTSKISGWRAARGARAKATIFTQTIEAMAKAFSIRKDAKWKDLARTCCSRSSSMARLAREMLSLDEAAASIRCPASWKGVDHQIWNASLR